MLHGKRDLANGITLRISRWRDYPALSGGPRVVTKVPVGGRQEGHTGDVTAEAEITGTHSGVGGRGPEPACGQPLEAGNGKKTVSLQESAEGTHLCQHVGFRILACRCGGE